MRVAVTGASGFAGSWIARELAAHGHEVHAFGRRPAADLAVPLPNYSQWDLVRDRGVVPSVDAVVHGAARVGHWGDEPAYRAVNVEGTRRVLAAFDNAEPFVHVSTSSVYDAGHGGRLTESAPAGHEARTAYARTKIEGERLVAASGRRAVILRPHIVYGPGDTTLLPRLLAARRRGWLAVPGNGANRVSVTHVLNLSHAVERSLLSAGAQGVFNIADAESPSVDELLQATFGRLGLPTRLVHIPRPVAWAAAWASETLARGLRARREPLLTRYVVASLADDHLLDISRARESLGYEPRSTFRDPWVDDRQDWGLAVQDAVGD